jgi:hypothetical protein
VIPTSKRCVSTVLCSSSLGSTLADARALRPSARAISTISALFEEEGAAKLPSPYTLQAVTPTLITWSRIGLGSVVVVGEGDFISGRSSWSSVEDDGGEHDDATLEIFPPGGSYPRV